MQQNTLADPTALPPLAVRPAPISHVRVRELIGEPSQAVVDKVQDRINPHIYRFIAHSPFLAIATAHADGTADSSPRGDYPGFVKVLDDQTLAIPDRIGNNRIDTFENLASDPRIGLLFLVPGHRETLRVNGRAYLTEDADVLARLEAEGKAPKLAIIVEVEEVFIHCGRAVLRSRLWDPSSTALAEHVPSIGEIVAARYQREDVTAAAVDEGIESAYKSLY